MNTAKQLCLWRKMCCFVAWSFEGKALLFSLYFSYGRFHEKSMFLNLKHCFMLAFSQCHLVKLEVETKL